MSHAQDLPLWAALATAVLVLLGAGLALIGAIGLLRFRGFFDRLHTPALGATLGIGCVLLASMLFFSVTGSRLVAHEVVVGLFMVVTTPVTLMLLARAAFYRDQQAPSPDAPSSRARHEPATFGKADRSNS